MSAPGSHICGWMEEPELQWLHDTARVSESVLEVGSWLGRSTFALCSSGCPRVVAVDHFRGSPEQQEDLAKGLRLLESFVKNVGYFENLRIMPVSSEIAASVLRGSFDFVFIDGAHDYDSVMTDLRLWAPRARRIAGHDIEHNGVKRALRETFGDKGFGWAVGSIWMRREK